MPHPSKGRFRSLRLAGALRAADLDLAFGPCPTAELDRVAARLPLPPGLRHGYAVAGPLRTIRIPAPLGNLTIPPVTDLVDQQSGYRWDGVTGERFPGWPDPWLVIADHEGDPVIADTASPGPRIGIAVHGTEAWSPRWLAPGVADALALLVCFVQAYVVGHLGSDDEPTDDVWPPAYHRRLAELLAERAPAVDAGAVLEYLGQ